MLLCRCEGAAHSKHEQWQFQIDMNKQPKLENRVWLGYAQWGPVPLQVHITTPMRKILMSHYEEPLMRTL